MEKERSNQNQEFKVCRTCRVAIIMKKKNKLNLDLFQFLLRMQTYAFTKCQTRHTPKCWTTCTVCLSKFVQACSSLSSVLTHTHTHYNYNYYCLCTTANIFTSIVFSQSLYFLSTQQPVVLNNQSNYLYNNYLVIINIFYLSLHMYGIHTYIHTYIQIELSMYVCVYDLVRLNGDSMCKRCQKCVKRRRGQKCIIIMYVYTVHATTRRK